jgi:DNA invertase Pin-like site-specific DNA recombinase
MDVPPSYRCEGTGKRRFCGPGIEGGSEVESTSDEAERVEELVKKLGVPLAEIARAVGISTSAVSKILGRRENNST